MRKIDATRDARNQARRSLTGRVLGSRKAKWFAAGAAFVAIASSAAHATTWNNSTSNNNPSVETAITVRLQAQMLFDKWAINIPPGQTGTATGLWTKINRIERVERVTNTSVTHALKSSNCIGVYGAASKYKITGDANGVTCAKR